jgi:glycosyltransferase involved in cell wall biosynthesis
LHTISVVIPCYNQGIYLKDALNSIYATQVPYSIEVIIVNDGSTDADTISVLEELATKGYNIIHQQNKGLAAARNNGIAASTGTYIIPLDADNKLHHHYLKDAIALLDNNHADIVYGNKQYFGDQDKLIRVGDFKWDKLIKSNYIDACAVYKKSIWEEIAGYDNNMPAMGNEDWDFWINAYLHGARFTYLNMLGFYYRITGTSMRLNVTNPAFELNKAYIIKKYASYFYSFYETNYRRINYIKNHRIKAGLNLILGRLDV